MSLRKTIRLVLLISSINAAISYERYPDFVDFTFHFHIGNIPASELVDLAPLLIDLAKSLPIGNGADMDATVCFMFYNTTTDPLAAFNVTGAFIDRVVDGPIDGDTTGFSRHDAHTGPIGFQVFAGYTNGTDSWLDQARRFATKPHYVANMVVSKITESMDATTNEPIEIEAVLAVIGKEPSDYVALNDTSFKALSTQLVQELANALRSAFNECLYEVRNSTCYYAAPEECVEEERPVRSGSTNPAMDPFCGSPPAKRVTECDKPDLPGRMR